MLIRSQDRISLISMDAVSQIYLDSDNAITIDFNNSDGEGFEIIGEYSTEDKAIKVLDMIQDNYSYCEFIKIAGQGIRKLDFIFQMPLDTIVKGGGEDE